MADVKRFDPVTDHLPGGAPAPPRAAGTIPSAPPPPGELEIRRRIDRLFARELADPSEELIGFVSARLDLEVDGPASEHLDELCRRALRAMGRDRWHPQKLAPRRDSDRRQLDRRRFEQHRALPGYYLG